MSFNTASDFIERVNEIEKQRRLIALKTKEYEAKTEAEEREEKSLIEKDAAMTEEENALKKELDRLTMDLHHTQLQAANLESNYRHSECEEPLLHRAASERLEKFTEEERKWTDNLDKMNEMLTLWQKDEVMAKLQAEIKATQEELEKLLAEETELQNEIARYEGQITAAQGTQGTALAPGEVFDALVAPGTAPTEDTLEGIQYLIMKEEQEFEAEQVLVTRQLSALQREVDDMRSRASELEQLKAQVTNSLIEVTRNSERVQRCLDAGLCIKCLESEGAST